MLAGVCGEAEVGVGVHGDEVLVGGDLVGDADAAALLLEADDAPPFLRTYSMAILSCSWQSHLHHALS